MLAVTSGAAAVVAAVDLVQARRTEEGGRSAAAIVVGIAGSVAVGKSTLAAGVAAALAGRRVVVVATDCFLLPNAELARRGLGGQKGFPASYDVPAIEVFLDAVAEGRPAALPVYSHATYDRVPGGVQTVEPADVVVVEGVNALQPPFAGRLDVAVYVDADEADIERWYVDRFLQLCTAAETDPTSFYAYFVPLSPDGRREAAAGVWAGINAVNLHTHIRPTMAHASLVLRKQGDHSFVPVSP